MPVIHDPLRGGRRNDFPSRVLTEYRDFLQNHQVLAKATIHIRENYVAPFLTALKITLPENIKTLSPSQIHDYVIKTAKSMKRASRKHLVSSLRSFLRFSHISGYLERNLVETIPIIATSKLAHIPRSISWDSVQKLLSAPDRKTEAGRRDYAILQLLATYGVRIGQVTTLRLKDIDWRKGLIHFQPSKRGISLRFPLQPEVADALLAYLRETRGKVSFPEIFLTVRGKPRPLSENNHLYSSMARYYRRAGIGSSIKGAHAIRHAFATRLMEQEVCLASPNLMPVV
jgi:integrase/recombinase XerD